MTFMLDLISSHYIVDWKLNLESAMDIAYQSEMSMRNRVAMYRYDDGAIPPFVLHLSDGAFYKFIWTAVLNRHVMSESATVYLRREDLLAEDWKVVVAKMPEMDARVTPVRDMMKYRFYQQIMGEVPSDE